MAKVAFTKFKLSKDQNIKIVNWNEQEIEVKQYLPIFEKMNLVSKVVNLAHDEDSNFSNPIKVKLYTTLEILFNYTNISFTDKQKEDILKLYDLIIGSGLYETIVQAIPKEEYDRIIEAINDTITAVYAYQNSVMGILDTIQQDYSLLDLDASAIQEKIGNAENIEFLKSVLAKLG